VVAGGVPFLVIDAFQTVDIHEGDNETPIGSPCTVDLMAELKPAYLATEGSRKIVEVSAEQLGFQAGTLASGLGLVLRGSVSAGHGPCPCRSATCTGRFGTGPDLPELPG
jgi:hypothetical protein